MKKENEVIYFEQLSYDSTVNSLKQLAKQINERPVEGDDSFLRRNGIINESFKSLCIKLGLTPELGLFKKVLNKNERGAADIISEAIEASLKSQKIHEALLPSIKLAQEPIIRQFAQIVQVLNSSYSRHLHSIFMATQRPINLEDYLSFEDGNAVVTDEALEALKQLFTTRLDTPLRSEIWDLLLAIAENVNRFNEAIIKHGLNHGFMNIDESYLSNENGVISPKNSVIKYF
jgi:hypothetical protein